MNNINKDSKLKSILILSFLLAVTFTYINYSAESNKEKLSKKQIEQVEIMIDDKLKDSERRYEKQISDLERRMDDNIESKIIDAGSYMSNKTMEAGEAIKEGFKAAKEKLKENKNK